MIPLRSLPLPTNARILLLGPHPDDFDAIGVSMRALHDQGHKLFVAVISGSASGVLDDFVGPSREAKAAARETEQRDSVRFFGLPDENLTFLRLPEDDAGDPIEDPQSEQAIRAHLESIRPDAVFLPHGNDTNAGHQRVYAMFRRIAATFDTPLTALYIRDPKTVELRTDVHHPFDESQALWKRDLLRHHRSQQHRNLTLRQHGFDDRLLQVNRDIASDLDLPDDYAEAFEMETFEPGETV